jgi:hypothetical protein
MGSELSNGDTPDDEGGVGMDKKKEDVRKAALEFMISLAEAKPGMVRKADGGLQRLLGGV